MNVYNIMYTFCTQVVHIHIVHIQYKYIERERRGENEIREDQAKGVRLRS
jgi:hypothetical protein